MKIKFIGFRLKLNRHLSLSELADQMSKQAGKSLPQGGYGRIISVEDLGDYFVGSILTMKGLTSFTEIDVKSLKMSVRELEKGKSLAVFNFFAIAKRNLQGLFSHYHTSASLMTFGDILAGQAQLVLELKREQEIKASNGSKKAIAKIKKEFKKPLEISYLASKKNLAQILDKWEKLKAFSYTVTHLEPGTQEFGGLKPFVRAKTTRLGFQSSLDLAALKRELLKAINRNDDFSRAKIEGVDEAGNDRIVDVIETSDWFGECDYTKTLSDKTLFSPSLSKSCMIDMILREMKDRPEHFDVDVKE